MHIAGITVAILMVLFVSLALFSKSCYRQQSTHNVMLFTPEMLVDFRIGVADMGKSNSGKGGAGNNTGKGPGGWPSMKPGVVSGKGQPPPSTKK